MRNTLETTTEKKKPIRIVIGKARKAPRRTGRAEVEARVLDELEQLLLDDDELREILAEINCSVGNPAHKKSDGTFTSSTGKGSWSIRANKKGRDCDRGQFARSGNTKTADNEECGRESPRRCYDNSIKEDELATNQQPEYLELHSKYNRLLKHLRILKRKLGQTDKTCSFETVNQCLKFISTAIDASKGNLTKDKKHK